MASGIDSGVDVRPAPLHLVTPELAAQVAAPAHDALTPDERARLLASSPNSFLHVYEDARAHDASGADRLRALLADGVFAPLPAPALALYRLRRDGHTQLGVVGDVPVAGYERGQVRPHEATHRDKELDLVRTREALAMTSSPVCLAHDSTASLARLIDQGACDAPLLDFTAPDGVEHTVWVLDQPDVVADLRTALAAVGPLYIIDGHHRCAAAARHAADAEPGEATAAPPATFLAVLFPFDDLCVASYHRCVARLAGPPEALLTTLREAFDVHALGPGPAERARPDSRGTFGLLLDGVWYRLRPREGTVPARLPESLDASVLQERVLGPVLGIDDPRDGTRIEHVPGTLGLEALATRCAARGEIAFVQHPVSFTELRAVADARLVMPPKTTCFEPKAGAGVFLRLH